MHLKINMKIIKIKSSGVVISSAVIAGLSLIAWLKSSDSFKNLSATLFFSSACVGVVSKCKSEMDERDVNDKLGQIQSTYEREKTNFETRLKTVTNNNRELQIGISTAKEQRELIAEELGLFKADYSALKVNLRVANEQIKRQAQEIVNREITVDTRFLEFLKEFIGKVANSLYDRIEQTYNSLDSNCLQLVNREEYSSIHDELTKFRATLETYHDHHILLVRDLEALDCSDITTLIAASKIAGEVMEVYNQVADELFSIKSKYRNLKIIDERRALQEYQETEQYKITKANAIQTLREQTNLDKSVIDRLQLGLNANTNGLSELIAGIGTDLEKANERVAQLSAPITWKFAVNHATRAGNLIIEYCKSLRIHLDRSHYTGDNYEVDLYFFTDRINAAATIDVKALNDEGQKLAQITHCLEPVKFTYEYETRLLIAHLVLQHRVVEKKQPTNPVEAAKQFIKPVEALLPFIKDAYHVGLWASTGGGKTTAISNMIGGMIQELGGNPAIRLTIPKMDADTQSIFPDVHWLGLNESIFGLLEAALEIQYRIYKNEQAYRAKEIIQDYEPTLFFIDEINAIFTRWRKINDSDLQNVLDRFEGTLFGDSAALPPSADRLTYFQSWMRLELTNYKDQFASKLLLFIWQTGRSLRVKSLIAGQNLMPSKLGLTINDLDNCSYISFGDSIKGCSKYKVRDVDSDLISNQYNLLQKAVETEDNLKYTALYCPSVGKSFFGILPPPNYYKWDSSLTTASIRQSLDQIEDTEKPKIAETFTQEGVDCGLTPNPLKSTPKTSVDASDSKGCKIFNQSGLLAQKYQNLDFKGYFDLLASLPKKPDGSVHKLQAYGKVFQIRKSDSRKLYSAFIDWLEANFR